MERQRRVNTDKHGEGRSRQAYGAGSCDPDGELATGTQEPSLAGVAEGEAEAARGAEELSVAILLERAILMFLSSGEPVLVREPHLCEEPAPRSSSSSPRRLLSPSSKKGSSRSLRQKRAAARAALRTACYRGGSRLPCA